MTVKTDWDLIQEKIDALEAAQRTAGTEEAKRIDAVLAALEAQKIAIAASHKRIEELEATIAGKAKEAVDGRLEPMLAKVTELSGSYDSLNKRLSKPEIPADAYFTCSECGSPLLLNKPRCPNEKCKAPVDWDGTLNDARAQIVEE